MMVMLMMLEMLTVAMLARIVDGEVGDDVVNVDSVGTDGNVVVDDAVDSMMRLMTIMVLMLEV